MLIIVFHVAHAVDSDDSDADMSAAGPCISPAEDSKVSTQEHRKPLASTFVCHKGMVLIHDTYLILPVLFTVPSFGGVDTGHGIGTREDTH